MLWLWNRMVLVKCFAPFSMLNCVSPCLMSAFLHSFLLGFVFPLMWYHATILYFGNHYCKDPRERAGLAASAIAISSK
ncbi:hypothetical protein SLEP1_g58694 [Rubroshorea leprosula]|uniref:Uncharacterized protein n=1 Tax=Rubroshorea leprosula TaxID=152421 RepID=A0AAV5MRC1_9ROSI|nr:hypothetical protein SLEP1_g58694 [Rubroshorea leprosula]